MDFETYIINGHESPRISTLNKSRRLEGIVSICFFSKKCEFIIALILFPAH
jgi:hypothetical protein